MLDAVFRHEDRPDRPEGIRDRHARKQRKESASTRVSVSVSFSLRSVLGRLLIKTQRLSLYLSLKFGHVSRYMLDVLQWLPLQQRISYSIISLVWRSLLTLAPAYLRDLCRTTMGIPGRRHLRSTEQGLIYSRPHLPTQQLCRIAPAQLLDPCSGMGFLWRSDCSLGLSLTLFTLI